MASLTELIRDRKKAQEKRKRPMTKEELDEQVIDWCDFYRKNWDIYAKYELEMESLHIFQLFMIYFMGICNYFFLMCGRGLGKSFMTSLGAFITCLLYPKSTVVITATTKPTARKMVKNKMEKELCGGFSPKLKYLYENGYIKFKYSEEETSVYFTFNGSKILVLPEVEASAGERATLLIFEEVRMSKQNIINRIFMPMRYSRPADYRLKEEYKKDKRLVEKAKVVYLTSTSYTFEWWFEKWRQIVGGFFNKKSKLKYGIFCGDIATSIYHGFTTQEEFDAIKEDPTVSEEEVLMEYYNEPQGGIDGSFYSMEKFKENQVIENGFVPPSYHEFVFDYARGDKPWFREKRHEEVRVIYVDFAGTDSVDGKEENDKTIIGCMCGYPNKQRTRIIRDLEYIEPFSGGKKEETLKRIRELFYFYDADVFIYDNRNIGEDRYIELTKSYFHEDLGIKLDGFGIYPDDSINNLFCDNTKTNYLRTKCVDSNARYVSIPVIGSLERNHNFHVSMQNAVNNNTFRTLMKVMSLKQKLNEDKDWFMKDSDVKARRVIGHIQVDKMIIEAVELRKDIVRGYIQLSEIAHHEKDRIVATIYANYFFTQLELKMLKGDQESDLSEEDFYDIYDVTPTKNIISRSTKFNSMEEDWENAFL